MSTPNSRVVEQIQSETMCPICLEQYRDPKILFCRHTFCQQCLENSKEGVTVSCPTCRVVTNLPEEHGVAGLDPAFHIQQLLDLKENLKNSSELEESGYFMTCARHNHRAMEFYCNLCQALCCSQCVFSNHNGHPYKKVDNVYQECKQELIAGIEEAASVLAKMNSLMTRFVSRTEEVENQQNRLEERINTMVNDLHQALENKRTSLVTELHKISARKVTSLSERKAEVNEWQIKLSNCIDTGSGLLQSPRKESIILDWENCSRTIKTNCSECKQADLEVHEEADTDILADMETTLQQMKNFAAITTCHSCPSKCYARGNALTSAKVRKSATASVYVMNGKTQPCMEGCLSEVNFKLTSSLDGNVISGVARRISDNQYNFTYNPLIKGYHMLSVTIRDQHIFGSPFRIAVTSSVENIGTRCRSIINMNSPCGIAVNQEGDVFAVCESKDSITVVKQNGRLVRETVDISKLADVTVGDDNCIYAVTRYENKIVKLSPEGAVLVITARFGSGPRKFNSPLGIAYNSKNKKLYLSNTGSHEIQILNEDLTFHAAFGSEGTQKGQFRSPVGICCDVHGRVIVADSQNDRVQIFTTDGQFIKMFGKSGDQKGHLSEPVGVATDACRQIYVSESGNHRVSIFAPDGSFRQFFGEDGVLKKPRGIAIDRKVSSVLVCNYGRDLVQLY